MKVDQNSLDGSAFSIVFLQTKHAGAAVLTCYSIPTAKFAVQPCSICYFEHLISHLILTQNL